MEMNDLKMEISYYENYIIRNKLFSKIGPNQIFIIYQLMSLIPLEVVKELIRILRNYISVSGNREFGKDGLIKELKIWEKRL